MPRFPSRYQTVNKILDELFGRYPALSGESTSIKTAFELLCTAFHSGGKLLCCGNGGSCADCDHIVGELMKSFKFKRRIDPKTEQRLRLYGDDGRVIADHLEGALPALSLCGHNALTTAFINDVDPQLTFAQQLYGIAREGDILIALTTSGNSANCIYAAAAAKAMMLPVIVFTGADGGKISKYADVVIHAPERETYRIQELHLPVYHALCAMLEAEFFI